MITYKQLLNNFTSLLGINSAYGRIAFEIFARQISQKLSPGDELEIDSLGFFAYRKVKNSTSSGEEFERIILFSMEGISAQSQNTIFFFLPDDLRKDFPSIDSFLDLSFNKSHVISKNETLPEFTLSSSFSSLESLIESKVERLIADGKVYKSVNKKDIALTSDAFKSEIIFDTASNAEVISLNDEKGSDEFVLDDEEREFDSTKQQIEDLETPEKTKLVFDDLGLKHDRYLKDDKSGFSDLTSSEEEEIMDQEFVVNDEENINLGKIRGEKSYPRTHSSTGKKILAALVVVFIVTAAVLIYNNFEVVKKFVVGEELGDVAIVKTKMEPEIITRTFEIPITYPYSKNVKLAASLNDSLIINPSIFIIPRIEEGIELSAVNSKSEELQTPKIEMTKFRGNVFQRGEEFLVQLSSWKSKVKAESEHAKFRDAGYAAELVEYYSRESGKYHRIMIGGFKSYDEAKEFLKQKK